MTTIILWCDGDPSVGIPGCRTDIDLAIEIDLDDKEARDQIGEDFVEIFKALWDNGTVYFGYSDQCHVCGGPVDETTRCLDETCYSNN